jgi:hypothetical protein
VQARLLSYLAHGGLRGGFMSLGASTRQLPVETTIRVLDEQHPSTLISDHRSRSHGLGRHLFRLVSSALLEGSPDPAAVVPCMMAAWGERKARYEQTRIWFRFRPCTLLPAVMFHFSTWDPGPK